MKVSLCLLSSLLLSLLLSTPLSHLQHTRAVKMVCGETEEYTPGDGTNT